MKVSSTTGSFQNSFDPQDVVFYLLEGNFNDANSHYVQEVNGDLRIADLRNAIQTHLDLLAIKLGLGDQYFKFEQNNATKTATEVISENSDLYRTIKKHEKVLENALTELVMSIIAIGNSEHLFSISDPAIVIDFDDSIIESKEQMRLQDRQDVAMDAMGLPEYRMKWYGEDEATANAKIDAIKAQGESDEKLTFIEGDIN
jgi:A118 family predicted phage portal protein